MKYCSNKEIDQLIHQLVRSGWRFYRGRKHGRLTHPSGRPTLTVASTPSDFRSLQNFRRDLRNAESAREVASPPQSSRQCGVVVLTDTCRSG